MACTGGWDWAPYTYTTQEGALTFTKGLWKSVSIESSLCQLRRKSLLTVHFC